MKQNSPVLVTAALLLATALAGCMGDSSLQSAAVEIVDAPDEAETSQPIDVSWRVSGDGEAPEDDADVAVGGNASAGNQSASGNASVDQSDGQASGDEVRTGLVWGFESVSDPQSPGDYENEAANESGTTGETFSASFVVDDPGTVYVSAWAEAGGSYVFSAEHMIEVSATGNGTIGGNGTAGNNTTAAGTVHTVNMTSAPTPLGYLSSFSPEEITIQAGDAVVWGNDDDAVHTATADDGSWDTGDVAEGTASEPIVFDEPGEYDYHCSYHGMTMSGTIIVEAAPGGNNTSALRI